MKTAELVIMPQRKRYVKIAPPELGKGQGLLAGLRANRHSV